MFFSLSVADRRDLDKKRRSEFRSALLPKNVKVQQTIIEVIVANSGKSPAKNVHQEISFRTLPASTPFSPKYPTEPVKIGVIQPGSRLKYATPPTEKPNGLQVDTYRSGRNVLYVFGRITYDDIFTLRITLLSACTC